MLNGLNTGGFDLQDDDAAIDITDRALTMLAEFLVSNQNLHLNSTFKVYLKILSVAHMNAGIKKQPNKRKFTGRVHVGGSKKGNISFNPRWAFDPSISEFSSMQRSFLQYKCLLVTTVIALLQHEFFLTEGKDTRFTFLSKLTSKVKKLRDKAFNLLQDELKNLFNVTKLKQTGPYELKATLILLHATYKCQFFIFNGITNSTQLYCMYPENYDDKLKPIFLLKSNLDGDHIVFIKNLNYFLGGSKSFCLACSKFFKKRYNQHLCKAKNCCFTCRKLLQTPETFAHKLLFQYFCDKNICSLPPEECPICSIPTYSSRCLNHHRKFCYGKGSSYYCSQCEKLIYGKKGQTSEAIRITHQCIDAPNCNFCFKTKDEDHLCELITDKIPTHHPRLGFFHFDYFYPQDFTVEHELNPCLAIILREDKKRSVFTKHIISEVVLNCNNSIEDALAVNYLPSAIETLPFRTKILNVKSVFCTNLSNLKQKCDNSCLVKVLEFFMDEKFSDTTYICQDSDSIALMSLLKGFADHGFCPNIVRKGKNIMLLEIPELNIRFLNSNNYVVGSEFEIASQFDLLSDPIIYFPHKFFTVDNTNYQGQIPSIINFQTFFDSSESRKNKELFISNYGKKKWILKHELLLSSYQKLYLLAITFTAFLKECYDLQGYLLVKTNKSRQYINPISKPLCTLTGFVFKLFKCTFLNDYPIFTVNHEYGTPGRQVSLVEYEFTSFTEFGALKDKKCMSAFNNKLGQKYFKHCIPDLFCLTTNEIYLMNGCFVHAHLDDLCTINKNKTEESPHPFGGTYKEQNEIFFSKLDKCMKEYPEIKKINITWECQFKSVKQTPEFKQFYANHFIPHPLSRLRPRDAVRGALSDVYALKWSKKMFPDEKFYCIDVNGLYSYCAVKYPYMIGKYIVLIGHDLSKLNLKNNLFFYENKHVMGSILLTFEAPSDLQHPFLLYRKKNRSVVLSLCKECAENESFRCRHTNKQKHFTATYMISEIEFALTLGYKIIHIHEAHIYTESEFILKDFVHTLNYFKILASENFKSCHTNKEKETMCKLIASKMNFDESQPIDMTNSKPNQKKRNFYKLMCNSLFGKFLQRQDKPRLRYISNQDELDRIFYAGIKINDFFCINDDMCLISTEENVLKMPPNRAQNVYIGSQITAYAREIIYRSLMQLNLLPNCKIYQIECDSLFFSLPRDQMPNVDFSPCLGDFKHVYGDNEIIGFYSLGQKQYCVNYLDGASMKSCYKVSGLSLSSEYNADQLNENSFEILLDSFIEGSNSSKTFFQKKTHSDFHNLKVISYQQKYTLTNHLSRKRFVNAFSDRLVTYPFGFGE